MVNVKLLTYFILLIHLLKLYILEIDTLQYEVNTTLCMQLVTHGAKW